MRNLILAAVAASALVAPAYAQTTTTPSATAPAATTTATTGAAKFVNVPNRAAMSEQITDLDIYNNAGEKVGEIEDVVINGKEVAGYVVSVGGFLGMGTKYVVIDPASVMITYDESNKKWNAKMDVSKDQVKAAPEYKYDAKHKS
ncbi:PRC-barrel domain-containing protein [Aquabacter sp. CN5-332]|uniref:PRC-barrel domain-containing protein n=1 Tax=Aquabacter sp. CN5-332 TaxID=3156608 RepID=UPI0032B4EC6E